MPAATVIIESLDQEGRGVAHVDGKAIFVEGALTGERVRIDTLKKKPSYEIARVAAVEAASASRVTPRCPHFGVCGGCTLQHADPALQIAAKQRALEEAFARIGRVCPETLLPPIDGPAWGYRHRARLSVRHVPKKGGVLVGFHERKSSFVADMTECHVVPAAGIGAAAQTSRADCFALDPRPVAADRAGDRRAPQRTRRANTPGRGRGTRAPRARSALDTGRSQARRVRGHAWRRLLAATRGVPGTVHPFHPPQATLAYTLPEFDVALPFAPTDFTQVNMRVESGARAAGGRAARAAAGRADRRFLLRHRQLLAADRALRCVGDRHRGQLRRWCGGQRRTRRGNALGDRASFTVANLFVATPETIAALGRIDRALIDPPREGAVELAKSLPHAGDERALTRIVYVSCNPATLARDAAVLVHERGYRLTAAGIVNMFPHTAHVESMAVFAP